MASGENCIPNFGRSNVLDAKFSEFELIFPDPMHEFDAGNRRCGSPKLVGPEHRTKPQLDAEHLCDLSSIPLFDGRRLRVQSGSFRVGRRVAGAQRTAPDWAAAERSAALLCELPYQAGSWTKSRRVSAKVEWHPGKLYPRVGFMVTNMARAAENVVAFYNKRLSNKTALDMIFKLAQAAEKHWRRLDGQNRLPKVILGVRFTDRITHSCCRKTVLTDAA